MSQIRQHRPWSTRAWDNHYGTRALVESQYAEFKGNISHYAYSLAIRTIGLEARGLAFLCVIAATNVVLIASQRRKTGEETHPLIEADPEPIPATYIEPAPETSPDPPTIADLDYTLDPEPAA